MLNDFNGWLSCRTHINLQSTHRPVKPQVLFTPVVTYQIISLFFSLWKGWYQAAATVTRNKHGCMHMHTEAPTFQLLSQVQCVQDDSKLALGEGFARCVGPLQVDVVKVNFSKVGSGSSRVDNATGCRGFQLVQQQLCQEECAWKHRERITRDNGYYHLLMLARTLRLQ